MAITSVTKDADDISYIENGILKKLSVSGSDIVISFPIQNCDRIINMYRRQSDGKIIVAYFDTNGVKQEIELDPTAGVGNMLKATYDANNDGVVDNSEKLEGSTKSQVQDHTPKAHALDSHDVPTGSVDIDSQRIINLADPTAEQDAATKGYIDLAVTNLAWDYYFNDTGSGIDSYYEMHPDPTGDPESTFPTGELSGSGQDVFQWISDEVVVFETIEAGVINVHVHAKRATGNKSVELYAIIYEYKANTSEVEIGTTHVSTELTNSEAVYDMHFTLTADYDIASTSKLLVKLFANLGSGSGTTIEIIAEGSHDTRISIPVPVHTLEDLYVRRDILDAQSLLIAISAGTPVVLTVAASRIVGRKSTGNIVALAKADILTIINVTEGADITGSNPPQAHDLAGSEHNADTLSDLNSKISDATILDQGTVLAFAIAL